MSTATAHYTDTDRRAAQAYRLMGSLKKVLPLSYVLEVKAQGNDPVIVVYDAVNDRTWTLSWSNSVRSALRKMLEPKSEN